MRILDFDLYSIQLQRFEDSIRILADVSGRNGKDANKAFHELFNHQNASKCIIKIIDDDACEINFSSGGTSHTFKDILMDYQRIELNFDKSNKFPAEVFFCFVEAKRREGCNADKWMKSIYVVCKDVEFKNEVQVEF